MKSLRKFEESDLELLFHFKNSLSSKTRQWSLERARRELMDFGRGYGENVLVEEDCGGDIIICWFCKNTN